MTKQVARTAIRNSIIEFESEQTDLETDEIVSEENVFDPEMEDRITACIAALRDIHPIVPDFYDDLDPISRFSVYQDALRGHVFNHFTQKTERFESLEYLSVMNHMQASYEERMFYRDFRMLQTISDENDFFSRN